jgi:hypothetical protein
MRRPFSSFVQVPEAGQLPGVQDARRTVPHLQVQVSETRTRPREFLRRRANE